MYRQAPASSHLVLTVVGGRLSAHDKATGRLTWVNERLFDGRVRLVIDGDRVVGFGGQRQGEPSMLWAQELHHFLFLLDYATGRVVWSVGVRGPASSAALLVDPPYVFLTSGATLSTFSLEDGRLVWEKRLGTDEHLPAVVVTHAGCGLVDPT